MVGVLLLGRGGVAICGNFEGVHLCDFEQTLRVGEQEKQLVEE